MKHLDINVSGKVQGVWFRQSTLEEAKKLGLVGTVENISDGTVKIAVEGSEEKLQELIEWCKEGPEHALVEDLTYSESKIRNYKGFSIV